MTPNFYIHEIFEDFNDDWTRQIVIHPVKVVNGYIELEDRPGWGTDLNYDLIKEHPYNPGYFLPLFRHGWEERKPVSDGT